MGTVATDSDSHVGTEPPSNGETCKTGTEAPRCCGDVEFVHLRAARLCAECRTEPWGPWHHGVLCVEPPGEETTFTGAESTPLATTMHSSPDSAGISASLASLRGLHGKQQH